MAGVTTTLFPLLFLFLCILSLLKLYLKYPAYSDLPRKESSEFSKALLLLSAFKTERGSLEQLTEKNRHYLKNPRAGVTGSQAINLFAKKIKYTHTD